MARKTPKMEISVATDSQVGTSTKISPNEKVHQGTVFFAKIIIPSYANNVTTKINLIDDEGDIVYSFPDLSRGATHLVSDFQCPLISKEHLTAELNGVPGGVNSYVIYVTLYYISDYR